MGKYRANARASKGDAHIETVKDVPRAFVQSCGFWKTALRTHVAECHRHGSVTDMRVIRQVGAGHQTGTRSPASGGTRSPGTRSAVASSSGVLDAISYVRKER